MPCIRALPVAARNGRPPRPIARREKCVHFQRGISAYLGFTILELMVSIAILAIVTSLALPSFAGMVERWRVHQTTKALLASIALARSEATRRGDIIMRRSSEQEMPACTTPSNAKRWECGWTITTENDIAISTIETQRDVVVLFRVGGNASKLVYHSSGRVSKTLGYGFVIIPAKDYAADPNNCSRAQRIAVSAAGRLRTESLAGTCP